MDNPRYPDDYTGKTIEKPLRVKNLITMLNSCDGESIIDIVDNDQIVVTNKKGEVEVHMPLTETFLVMKNGDLDGQGFEHFKK